MKELYLEIFSDIDSNGTCVVPLETAICLFTIIYCNGPPMLLTFVFSLNTKKKEAIRICVSEFIFEIINKNVLEGVASACKLPVIVTYESTTVVAGLCAVLRQIIKIINPLHSLLGFKQSCLYACAESSPWTKFCEVDIIETVNHLLAKKHLMHDILEIPLPVARFETHMSQPVKIHNIEKKKKDLAKAKGLKNVLKSFDEKLNLAVELEHVYAEGPQMTLADVMLFPSFHIIFKIIGSPLLKQFLPLSYKWLQTVGEKKSTKEALKLFSKMNKKFEELNVDYIFPKVSNHSLYKGDVKKKQQNHKHLTKQKEIVECFQILDELKATIEIHPLTFGYEIDFDWDTVPSDFRTDEGQIPLKRLHRKGQQLANMIKAVLKVARNGDKIVDFCSGSGHLGLILAHALPRCFVTLLENKEQSLNRAREKAAKLKLSNVVFCQSNIDYFKGHFNIGVSLHACGVATDLVIEKCISEKASFICCPCCYGFIQDNHMIHYPRSKVFQNSRMTFKNYLVLGHSSDQTHYEDNEKTCQGNQSMLAIDSDRLLRAKEEGYRVTLSKLDPPSCTPKNNLLVGIPQNGVRLHKVYDNLR